MALVVCMLLVRATNCIGVFFCCLLALATFESSSNEVFITFVRTMTDLALQTRVNDLAKQLSDLKTGIVPSVTQQSALLKKVTELGSEVAAVRTQVNSDNLTRNVHSPLDQPQAEIIANFYLAAALPDLTEVSVEWLDKTDMVTSVTNRGTNVTGDKRYHGIYVVHQTERVVLSDCSVLRHDMSQTG